MNIETTVTITPDDADAAGRLLLALAEARTGAQLRTGAVEYAFRTMMPNEIMTVANALLALGNDTDAIIAPGDEDDMPAYMREHFEEQDRITAGYDAAVEDDDISPRYMDIETYARADTEVMFKSSRTQRQAPKDACISPVHALKIAANLFGDGAGGDLGENVEYERGIAEFIRDLLQWTDDDHTVDSVVEMIHSVARDLKPNRFKVISAPTGWAVWDRKDRRFCDGVFENRNTAETWALVLSRTEIEETIP